jgi:hypothetical protein
MCRPGGAFEDVTSRAPNRAFRPSLRHGGALRCANVVGLCGFSAGWAENDVIIRPVARTSPPSKRFDPNALRVFLDVAR